MTLGHTYFTIFFFFFISIGSRCSGENTARSRRTIYTGCCRNSKPRLLDRRASLFDRSIVRGLAQLCGYGVACRWDRVTRVSAYELCESPIRRCCSWQLCQEGEHCRASRLSRYSRYVSDRAETVTLSSERVTIPGRNFRALHLAFPKALSGPYRSVFRSLSGPALTRWNFYQDQSVCTANKKSVITPI